MAWDPTFDWTDASSFNGEARKLSILTEMIIQLNLKCDIVSETNLTQVAANGLLDILLDFNSKFNDIATEFYDQIADDGTNWTIAKLETEIGTSRPDALLGNPFTPTWINWMYQAIELLLGTFNISDYWDDYLGSSGAYSDSKFSKRWSLTGSPVGTPVVNTVAQTFEFLAEDYNGANLLSTEAAIYLTGCYMQFSLDLTDFYVAPPVGCRFTHSPYVDIYRDDSVRIYGNRFSGDYSSGIWKIQELSGTIYVYFNASLVHSFTYTGLYLPFFQINNLKATIGEFEMKTNAGAEIPL